MQILLSVEGVPLSYLFFPLPPLEQVLLEPAIEAPFISLAKLEAMAIVALIPHYFVLEPVHSVLIISSVFLPPSYSSSNSYPMQLLNHTTSQ